jgi:hypothetical protein
VEPLYGNDVSVGLSVARSIALSSFTDLLNALSLGVEPLYGNDVSFGLSVARSIALSSFTDLLNALRFWNTVFSNRRKGSYRGFRLFLYQNATVPLG